MKKTNQNWKPFVTAGLIGAMVAPSILSPVAAIAQASNGVTDAPDTHKLEFDDISKFSEATQRLIAAANGEAKMTFNEAKAALAEVEARANTAAAADSQAKQTVASTKSALDMVTAAVPAATAAVNDELANKAQALKDELTAAKQALAKLEQQKTDLEFKKADAQAKLDELKKIADEADAKKSDAQKKLDDAQAALDALGENPTSAEQDAYDAAKAAVDSANASAAEKRDAYETAKSTLESLRSQLADANTQKQTADSKLAAAESDKQAADAELASAKSAYAATVERISAESVAGPKATLAAKQAAYDSAVAAGDETAIASAKAELGAAQVAYDEAVATAGSKAESQAQAAIDAAQAKVTDAQSRIDAATAERDAIPGKIDTLNAQVAEAESKLSSAKSAKADADVVVTDAQAKLDAANKALQDALASTDMKTWTAKEAELKKNVADAKAAYTAIDSIIGNDSYDAWVKNHPGEKAYGDEFDQDHLKYTQNQIEGYKKTIVKYTQQIAEIDAKVAEAKHVAVDSTYTFLAWLNAKTKVDTGNNSRISACSFAWSNINHAMDFDGDGKADDMSGWIDNHKDANGKTMYDYTDPTGADKCDATTLDNLLKALDAVDELNRIREYEGLDTLEVSSAGMVQAMMNANWSMNSKTIGHAMSNGFCNFFGRGSTQGENAAYGYITAKGTLTGLYWQEKANYLQQQVTDFDGNVYTPEKNAQVGHYKNIINKNYKYVGVGVNTNNTIGYRGCWVYDFAAIDTWGGKPTTGHATAAQMVSYTTSELRDLIKQAQSEGVDQVNFAYYEDMIFERDCEYGLKDTLADYQKYLKEEQPNYDLGRAKHPDQAAALDAWNEAQAALDAHEANKPDATATTDTSKLEAAVNEAQAKLTAANEAQVKAAANVTKAENDLADARSSADAEVENFNKRIDALNAEIAQATSDRASAESVASDVKAAYGDLSSASAKLKAARDTADKAEGAYAEAKDAVISLNANVAELNGKIASAEVDYNAKLAALSQAGATQEQIDAMNSAKDALDAAKAKLATLTAARDDAFAVAESAKSASDKAAAEFKVAENSSKADAEALANATAGIPAAKAKVEAWEDALSGVGAEDMVKTGEVQTDNAEVTAAVENAHNAYQSKLDALAKAKQDVVDAQKAYDEALVNKQVTTSELAEKLADLAMAQDAYNRLCEQLKPAAESVQTVSDASRTSGKTASDVQNAELPKTGDTASATAAIAAAAGMAALAGGAHFRRRRDEE